MSCKCSKVEPLGIAGARFFYGPDALPVTQPPTVSKHWRKTKHSFIHPSIHSVMPELWHDGNNSFFLSSLFRHICSPMVSRQSRNNQREDYIGKKHTLNKCKNYSQISVMRCKLYLKCKMYQIQFTSKVSSCCEDNSIGFSQVVIQVR